MAGEYAFGILKSYGEWGAGLVKAVPTPQNLCLFIFGVSQFASHPGTGAKPEKDGRSAVKRQDLMI